MANNTYTIKKGTIPRIHSVYDWHIASTGNGNVYDIILATGWQYDRSYWIKQLKNKKVGHTGMYDDARLKLYNEYYKECKIPYIEPKLINNAAAPVHIVQKKPEDNTKKVTAKKVFVDKPKELPPDERDSSDSDKPHSETNSNGEPINMKDVEEIMTAHKEAEKYDWNDTNSNEGEDEDGASPQKADASPQKVDNRSEEIKFWDAVTVLKWRDKSDGICTKHQLHYVKDLVLFKKFMKKYCDDMMTAITATAPDILTMDVKLLQNMIYHCIAKGEIFYSQCIEDPEFIRYLDTEHQNLFDYLE